MEANWISVKKRLPPHDIEVLVCCEVNCGTHTKDVIDIDAYNGYCKWWYSNENVTHWMYLPPYPKEEDYEDNA